MKFYDRLSFSCLLIGEQSKPYVVVTLSKIKAEAFTSENAQINAPAKAVPGFDISLRDLFANINPADGKFLIPASQRVLLRVLSQFSKKAEHPADFTCCR